MLLVVQRNLVGELVLIDKSFALIKSVVIHILLHDMNTFPGMTEYICRALESSCILHFLFFQHIERGFFITFQTTDNLRNTFELAIDILSLVFANYSAASTFADVNLINGHTGADYLSYSDILFDHHPLDG